jgi:hypothetical protein
MTAKCITVLVSTLFLWSATTLAVPPHAPNTTIPVRFHETAMPVGRLLQSLSKRTGVRLECAPEVVDDVLLLQVDNVPLAQVMSRIAEADDARWRRVDDSWRLERPEAMAKAEQRREMHERAVVIARHLQMVTSPLRKPWNAATLHAAIPRVKHFLSTGSMDSEIDHMPPLWRAFLRCLSDISPEEIAQIPVGGRAVFATNPTHRQFPLGKGAQEALAKLPDEQSLFGKVLQEEGIEGHNDDMGHGSFVSSSFDFWQQYYNFRRVPARILLSISNKWSDSYEGELTLLDEHNKILVRMGIDEEMIPLSDFLPNAPTTKGSPIVPLSHDSQILKSVQPPVKDTSTFQGPVTPQVSAEARAILTTPEQHEPLGLVVSDGYIALARAKKRNLIAALPDRLLKDRSPFDTSPLTVSDVPNLPPYGPRMRITDRGGWLIVTPPDPYEARLERADRTVLGRIARRVAQAGVATIKDVAELAAHSGNKPMYHFDGEYLWALSNGKNYSSGAGNWTLLCLYGSLTDEEQQMLLSGKTVSYRSLNPWQRSFAEMAVYGARYNSSGEGTGTQPPAALGDLSDEPTQCFPDDLPPALGIHATTKRKTLVYFQGPGKTEFERNFWRIDATSYGPFGYEGPPPRVPREGFNVVRYQIHYQNSISVTVDLTPWYRMEADYNEEIEPATGPPVPFSKLPADIQKRVQKDIDFLQMLSR